MKKILLLTTLLYSITLFGQITTIKPLIDLKKISDDTPDNTHVYKWEAYTAQGVIIFGVNKTKADAEWTIKDFTKRNQKNTYKPITYVIKQTETTSASYFQNFKKKYPRGYKVLMQRDVIALRLIKVKSMNSAASFIESVTKKNNSEAFEYVFKLSNNFKTYSINY